MDNITEKIPIGVSIIDPVGIKAGMDQYDLNLACSLVNASCRVKVYSNFADAKHKSFIDEHFAFYLKNNFYRGIRLLAQFIGALKKSKREKLGIVILHVFHFSWLNYLFIILIKKFGFKLCLIVHDVESLVYSGSKSRLKKSAEMADCMVVHNMTTYNELLGKMNVFSKEKLHIIPHGKYIVELEKEKREVALEYYNLDSTKHYLLFFGMIKKEKSLEVLIDAMAKLPENIHLIIAGRMRGISFDVYAKQIEESKLTNRVHPFIRYITNEERHLFFGLSDLSILPYRRIYQSGVLLMAMSYGLPVVASDLPANREVINNSNGRLFRVGDASDLAFKVNSLIENVNEREAIATNAMVYLNQNHDWADIAGRFLKLLKEIK